MFEPVHAFSGFSVNDLAAAKAFYAGVLGLQVEETPEGLKVALPEGGYVFAYPKENHEPATFTILNLVVADIDAAVDELVKRGVTFERYSHAEMPFEQDERGIARGETAGMGPDIAWLKDPAGNILSLIKA